MIEVFKTNVKNADESAKLIRQLQTHFPSCKINFDLDDCDRILRIEGGAICTTTIITVLQHNHYQCEILE